MKFNSKLHFFFTLFSAVGFSVGKEVEKEHKTFVGSATSDTIRSIL